MSQVTLQQYIAWIQANGVEQTPVIEQGQALDVVGYEPSVHVVWSNGRGTKLLQQANLILNGNGGFEPELREVQAFLEITPATQVTWDAFFNPPQTPTATADPVVGLVFEGDGGVGSLYYVNASGVQEGALYKHPDGRRFIAVARGMFDRKWKRIA